MIIINSVNQRELLIRKSVMHLETMASEIPPDEFDVAMDLLLEGIEEQCIRLEIESRYYESKQVIWLNGAR